MRTKSLFPGQVFNLQDIMKVWSLCSRSRLAGMVIGVAAGLLTTGSVYAQCSTAPIQSLGAAASTNKCGYTSSCTPTNDPIKHVFLQTKHIQFTQCSYTYCWGDYFYYYDDEEYTETMDPHSCTAVQVNNGNCSGFDSQTYASGTEDSSGNWTYSGTGSMATYAMYYRNEVDNNSAYSGLWNTVDTCNISQSSEKSSLETTCGEYSGVDTASANTLSSDLFFNPYTDDMLRGWMMSLIPGFSTNWGWGCCSAFYHLSTDHTSCSGGRMKYHFWLCDQDSSQKGQQFLLQWTQVTVYDDTNKPPLIEQMQGTVTGNGSTNGMFVLEHFKDVPGEPSTITESDAVVTPIGSGSTPGNGG